MSLSLYVTSLTQLINKRDVVCSLFTLPASDKQQPLSLMGDVVFRAGRHVEETETQT